MNASCSSSGGSRCPKASTRRPRDDKGGLALHSGTPGCLSNSIVKEADVYGTIYRFRVKAGEEQALQRFMEMDEQELRRLKAAGMIASHLYKLDDGGYMGAVLWDTKERYHANANDPAQDRWYRQFRELLEADPEWSDGEIIASVQ